MTLLIILVAPLAGRASDRFGSRWLRATGLVLLALPVVSVFHGGLTPVSSGYLIGMAIVLALMSGMQGRSWALWANIGMQFVLILGAFIDVTIGIVGIIFLLVWVLIAYLRSEVKRRQDRGLLPGQQ